MIPKNEILITAKELNSVKFTLISLLDNFKSLKGNLEVIDVFFDQYLNNKNIDKDLAEYITRNAIDDLKKDLSDYEEYLIELKDSIQNFSESNSIGLVDLGKIED